MSQTDSSKPAAFSSNVSNTPAVSATGTNGANGVDASSDTGTGVSGRSSGHFEPTWGGSSGIAGEGEGDAAGVFGKSANVAGVSGLTATGAGVYGASVQGGVGGHFIAHTFNGQPGVAALFEGEVQIDQGSTNHVALQIRSSGPGWGSGIQLKNTSPIGRTYGIYSGQDNQLHFADVDASVDRIAVDGSGLYVLGNIKVTGEKHFVQAHPTDPNREIVYTTLEGGEAGTYTRGSWKLDNGRAVIKLPEHFGLVTSEDGLTVQLTPRGEWLQLYVVSLNTQELVVQEAQAKSGRFDYFIQGVRKGYEHHEVIQERK